jgi:hypothetical protein
MDTSKTPWTKVLKAIEKIQTHGTADDNSWIN